MKIRKVELEIGTDDNLPVYEIMNLLEDIEHPDVQYIAVSKVSKHSSSRFLNGFTDIWLNFLWWRTQLNPVPSQLKDDSMFWAIFCRSYQ